jgi:hypothetical protein
MNLIRGKKFQSKRIQIDFVSEIFLTRFSNIIQQKKRYVLENLIKNYFKNFSIF